MEIVSYLRHSTEQFVTVTATNSAKLFGLYPQCVVTVLRTPTSSG